MKDLVEQYVNITRQLKNLEERQKELSEAIKSHGPGRYEGDSDYVAVQVTAVSGRKTTNWAGVCAEADVPPAVVAKHTTKGADSLRLTVVL